MGSRSPVAPDTSVAPQKDAAGTADSRYRIHTYSSLISEGKSRFKLRFRQHGRQIVRYVGSDPVVASQLRDELAQRQSVHKELQQLEYLTREAKRLLRRIKGLLAEGLETRGYRFHGLRIRRAPRSCGENTDAHRQSHLQRCYPVDKLIKEDQKNVTSCDAGCRQRDADEDVAATREVDRYRTRQKPGGVGASRGRDAGHRSGLAPDAADESVYAIEIAAQECPWCDGPAEGGTDGAQQPSQP